MWPTGRPHFWGPRAPTEQRTHALGCGRPYHEFIVMLIHKRTSHLSLLFFVGAQGWL
jgi:hypothetical protein